jgi:putative RNA 2'-phosphotransferase
LISALQKEFMSDLVRLSKFLAILLRHKADQFGLTLDSEGFTDTDAVWEHVTKRYGDQFTDNDLLEVVKGDKTGKKRYEIQGRKIRALFGHSEVPRVTYPPAVPPEHLYHGTTKAALPIIQREGLKSLSRQYVHFTTNRAHADRVAGRHSRDTVILTIRAADAHHAGIVFYHPEQEHYLADAIPPEFIDFP